VFCKMDVKIGWVYRLCQHLSVPEAGSNFKNLRLAFSAVVFPRVLVPPVSPGQMGSMSTYHQATTTVYIHEVAA
jgi:hypothetical protein